MAKKRKLTESGYYAVKLYARSPLPYFMVGENVHTPAVFTSRRAARDYAAKFIEDAARRVGPTWRDVSIVPVAIVQS